MQQQLFDLSGKKAIVTGGGRGLSMEIAQGLHDAGETIAIIDIGDYVTDTAEKISKSGAKVYPVQGDLLDRNSRIKLFEESLEKLDGQIDILVNSAGIIAREKTEDLKLEVWDRVIELNLTCMLNLCQLAAKHMLLQKKGKIINVASMLSFFGGFTVASYAASKGGVAQLTKALNNEWMASGINVNAIAPGYMDTEMNAALKLDPKRNEEILGRIPAHEWGPPSAMRGPAVFLASAASDYLGGCIIPVDGGYLVR
jgi:2-deoxy-D-gluconate 3-dehydrogenase